MNQDMDYLWYSDGEEPPSPLCNDDAEAVDNPLMDDISDYGDGDGSCSDWSSEWSSDEDLSYREKLKNLFLEINLEQAKGTAILKLLREHPCFSSLPADHRTLVGTPQATTLLKRVDPGEYLHLGVEKKIVEFLEGIPNLSIPEFLEADFSIDGANLDKSGYICMWPIQLRLVNIPNSPPFMVGIYKGKQKPSSADEFFEDFIDEVNNILDNGGITLHGKKIRLVLRCFIGDAPARAFALNHKGHTGYNSCSKCDERQIPRTDEDYRNQIDEDHHHGPAALARLPFDLVAQVPFDYMHLSLIGSVKRQTWATVGSGHNFSKSVKLCAQDIEIVNARLHQLRSYCPHEFARRPGKITDYARFKATEFRQLILYTGPVIYHGIYKSHVYEHYLLHHASLRCLVSPTPSQLDLQFAEIALEEWINGCADIYGINFPSYNVHGHKHLVEDVRNFGPLDNISAFEYENHMQILRKMCRKSHKPLQRIARRTHEKSSANFPHFRKLQQNNGIRTSQEYMDGPLPRNFELQNISHFKLIKNTQFTLGVNGHDNCCILNDSSICIIRNIVVMSDRETRHHYLIVNKFGQAESWFNCGIDSTRIGSWKCSNLEADYVPIALSEVSAKCYRMPFWSLPGIQRLPSIEPLPGTFIVTAMLN